MKQLLNERKKILRSFDLLYKKNIRSLCLDFFGTLIRSILYEKNNTLTRCLDRQYKKIKKTRTVQVTPTIYNFLILQFKKFIRSKNKELRSKKIHATIRGNYVFFRHQDIHDSLISIELKQGSAAGWARLYKTKSNFVHEVTFTGVPLEFYSSVLFLHTHSLKYILKDVLFQLDSIYYHEMQHVLDDVNTKILGTARADEYYYKILERDTSYYYNRYLHHPVELAANMRQLAFLLHTVRRCNRPICAVRFYNFFQRYKAPRYATSFKESEICKYSTLFKRTKKHTTHWYVLMFKLLNKKYFELYKCSILYNINTLKKVL